MSKDDNGMFGAVLKMGALAAGCYMAKGLHD